MTDAGELSTPDPQRVPAPVRTPVAPTTRTWVLWGLWRALLLAISLAGVVATDGWRRWVWVVLLALVVVTTWLFRPGRGGGVRVPAALSRPGNHRVVLQLPGDKPVLVVRQLRRITGADLATAMALLESAPVVVVESLSQESAAEAAHLLQAAGARATVTPMDDAPPGGAT
jgi:hypothetical protein